MKNRLDIESKKIEELEHKALDAIFKGQKKKVKKLYGKVESLFVKGSDYTRSLIANKFILSLSQLLEINYKWGREYLRLFPRQLKAEYCRQINSCGI
ncbi:DUF7674 family protein [Peijinzhouia sedimentorum]